MTELYKKHRPTTLARVLGQDETTKVLQGMLEENRVPHSILLTGPSGCGKTTIARILRTSLECSDQDFQEVNCADFRGVDMVRDIRRQMGFSPVGGKCRVWMIDECHKLTNDAQNAILKILEDTPKHVFFILATTDPQKLIRTIRTRCTELTVRDLSEKELVRLVKRTARKEKVDLPEEVVDQIVQDSLGSARMALVLLDKILGLDPGEMLESVRAQAAQENEAIELCRALLGKKPWKTVSQVLRGLQGDPESVRYAVLGYATSVLLGGGKQAPRAYLVIDAFRENFYDSKKAGLVAACYEVSTG